MKIEDVEIYSFDLPLEQPFRIAIGTVQAANNVLIRIRTKDGLIGLGEACPFAPITGETQETNLAIARSLRDMLIGKEALAIEPFLNLTGSLVHSNPSIVAAFDMAFYDILGKAASLPVYSVLGGEPRRLITDITVDLDTPEKMAARAEKFIGQGYQKIKIKVGEDPDLDMARLEAIRNRIGTSPTLSIDANQGWTVPQAISALSRMEKFKIEFVEQPVAAWDTEGLRRVRQHSLIPIMADEALFSPQDALKLIKAEACDYFNIKLMKAGGIGNSLKIAHLAEAANIRVMVGCMLETRLALTAAAHLMTARNNIIFADLDGNMSHTIDPILGGMEVKGGVITLPDSPGLGVDIDRAFLKKLRRL
ncbi:MAG: mandelate racemase/muconate lactonizing enzyme family protein [Candidatus Aminicenantales bacterium]